MKYTESVILLITLNCDEKLFIGDNELTTTNEHSLEYGIVALNHQHLSFLIDTIYYSKNNGEKILLRDEFGFILDLILTYDISELPSTFISEGFDRLRYSFKLAKYIGYFRTNQISIEKTLEIAGRNISLEDYYIFTFIGRYNPWMEGMKDKMVFSLTNQENQRNLYFQKDKNKELDNPLGLLEFITNINVNDTISTTKEKDIDDRLISELHLRVIEEIDKFEKECVPEKENDSFFTSITIAIKKDFIKEDIKDKDKHYLFNFKCQYEPKGKTPLERFTFILINEISKKSTFCFKTVPTKVKNIYSKTGEESVAFESEQYLLEQTDEMDKNKIIPKLKSKILQEINNFLDITQKDGNASLKTEVPIAISKEDL